VPEVLATAPTAVAAAAAAAAATDDDNDADAAIAPPEAQLIVREQLVQPSQVHLARRRCRSHALVGAIGAMDAVGGGA